ncbi:MAG: response regulator transcription factor [Chitinophagaceae bacterium]|nr:MAG: response regulator transcription factor [Chitinophagaceae bacterium]
MRVLIAEDEPLGAARLSDLLADLDPSIEVCGIVESIAEGREWYARNPPPDLIFLDIELADGQSFSLLSELKLECPVIFTTSYSQHALRAFEWNSVDYLLKPIGRAQLQNSLEKYRRRQPLPQELQALLKQLETPPEPRFLVSRGQQLRSFTASEIAYFEGHDKLVELVTLANERFAVPGTLEEIGHKLKPGAFFRANRSFLVQAAAVELLKPDAYGKLRVYLRPEGSTSISVSRSRAVAFKKWLGK